MKMRTLYSLTPIYLLLTATSLLPTDHCFSQAPAIDWQAVYGGTQEDGLIDMIQTSDGGYLLGGMSASGISGIKTEPVIGGDDLWVIKVNATGAVEWQNTIGSSEDDFLTTVAETPDGGYLIGAYTSSSATASGDLTESTHGYSDMWIIKLNASGNIAWQQLIGSDGSEELYSMDITSDGGVVLCGATNYEFASGDRSQNGFGIDDYWVVKLDITGNIEWEKIYGGEGFDRPIHIEETQDGGYVVGGYSFSPVSGNKTEASMGSGDYWILRLSNTGVVIWQNTINGDERDELYDVKQTSDGGFILAGTSDSDAGLDKTENSFNSGVDYWVIKLSYDGNIVWQNTIGGNSPESVPHIIEMPGAGFLLSGETMSGISGDKTEIKYGSTDHWLIRLNTSGNIVWQKVIGGSGSDGATKVIRAADGTLVVSGYSWSGVSGNKTLPAIGAGDYWLVKLFPETCIATTEICNGFDDDCDGLIDDSVVASEICNSVDDDCDGLTDEGMTFNYYYLDFDGDDFGDELNEIYSCTLFPDFETNDADCNDASEWIYPGADELVNGIDDNCDGFVESWEFTDPGFLTDYGLVTYGYSVAGAGDVNGDGFDDILVGDNRFGLEDGELYIYHGNAGGYDTEAATVLDEDEDQTRVFFATSVSPAGDVNGDGYDDIIIGASQYDNGQLNEGRAFVYHGSAAGVNPVAATILESNQAEAKFGVSVSSAGDINADGYDDIIVGANEFDNGETNEGRAYIYLGSPTGINPLTVVTLENNQALSQFGYSVSGAGDVNGDNFDDVIIGAYNFDNGQTNEGRVYVYHGSATGIMPAPATLLESNQAQAIYGISVSGAGDVNNDGFDDIIIGAENYDNGQFNEGRAYIHLGSASGVNIVPQAIMESNQASAAFGVSVNNAGDLNNDNYADVIVGANMFTNHEEDEGRIYVYYGSASGIDIASEITMEIDEPASNYGFSVAGAGDLNGDNYDDLIVGAYTYKEGGTAVVYLSCHAVFYPDVDGDGYGDALMTTTACDAPVNYVANDMDCAALDEDVHPGATEICNGIDDNCNGLIDDGVGEAISITAAGPTVFCQGNSVLLEATATGTDLQWKKNGVNLAGATSSTYLAGTKGTYTCVLTDLCGTVLSNEIFVDVNKNPAANITADGATTFCAGGSVTLNEAPVGGSTYQWYKGATPIAGATAISYVATTAGNYKCRVTKTATGCFKNSNVINVTVPCREDDPFNNHTSSGQSFTMYPNPNSGSFTLEGVHNMPMQRVEIKIYNSTGEIIYTESIEMSENMKETVNLGDIPAGIYIVRLIHNGVSSEQKLIIE